MVSAKQCDMSDMTSRTNNLGLSGKYSATDTVGLSRNANTYNRTSVALQFPDDSFPSAQPVPVLNSNRRTAGSRAETTSMFQGLDQYASNQERGSSVLAFLIHLFVIFAILWWTTLALPRVVQSADTAVVKLPFTLYDPPPPQVMQVAKVQGARRGWWRGASTDCARQRKPSKGCKNSTPHPLGSCKTRASQAAR